MDKLGIHVLQVCEDEKLFQCRVVAHVAILIGVSFAPFAGGLAEEGDVEQVGLAGVGEGGLLRSDLCWNQVGLYSVGVQAVIDLGEGAIQVLSEGETTVFVFLEPLELLDEVEFEFDRNPGCKL
ncbi:hypothetical protein LGV61_05050 [Desulfurispirillum indicum]|nr:hypothetical protein [Desulfurispirillum indicum]UCZ57647.1 hypothetical protein LGV61_05050 [Desulfurispirillum indicum]